MHYKNLYPAFLFQFEVPAEVVLAHYGVGSQLLGGAVEEYLALKEQIGAVGNHQGLVHIVVGDEDTDVLIFEPPHHVLNLLHGDGVNARKRLVQHHKLRLYGEATGYLRTAALATRQTVTEVLAHMRQVELRDELLQFLLLIVFAELGHLQDRLDVILYGHLAEDARFLRQVADTQLRAFVHRVVGDIFIVEEYLAGIGGDEPRRHVESGRLAGTVGSQQSDNLALLQTDAHIVDHRALAIFLYQMFST